MLALSGEKKPARATKKTIQRFVDLWKTEYHVAVWLDLPPEVLSRELCGSESRIEERFFGFSKPRRIEWPSVISFRIFVVDFRIVHHYSRSTL